MPAFVCIEAATDHGPSPAELCARTRTSYATTPSRPVSVAVTAVPLCVQSDQFVAPDLRYCTS